MTGATRSVAALLAAAALCLSAACGGEGAEPGPGASPDGGAATTTAATEATGELGPYGVGRRTVTVTDPARDGRQLTVDLWYPTDTDDGEPSTYEFVPGIAYDSETALAAPPVAGGGPFPLVIYSHGSGGVRFVASFHTELLASHGFVVAAPDHAGNTVVERFLGTTDPVEDIRRDRPADISFVIDSLLDPTGDAAVDEVGAIVDPASIGVSGHSFGGFTALAIAGGQGDIAPDERVSAIVAMAPASSLLTDADLAGVDVPTMVVSGTDDITTPIDDNTTRAAAAVAGRPLLRVDIEGAGHQSFTDVCDYTVLLRDLPDIDPAIVEAVDALAEEGCGPDFLPADEVQQIVNRYAVAFFLSELAGDDGAAAVLTAEAAGADADITFERSD